MKKAKIFGALITDDVARWHESMGQGNTIIEILVETKAELGEHVRLEEPYAKRCVIRSSWTNGRKAVHFSASDWLALRDTTPAWT